MAAIVFLPGPLFTRGQHMVLYVLGDITWYFIYKGTSPVPSKLIFPHQILLIVYAATSKQTKKNDNSLSSPSIPMHCSTIDKCCISHTCNQQAR